MPSIDIIYYMYQFRRISPMSYIFLENFCLYERIGDLLWPVSFRISLKVQKSKVHWNWRGRGGEVSRTKDPVGSDSWLMKPYLPTTTFDYTFQVCGPSRSDQFLWITSGYRFSPDEVHPYPNNRLIPLSSILLTSVFSQTSDGDFKFRSSMSSLFPLFSWIYRLLLQITILSSRR